MLHLAVGQRGGSTVFGKRLYLFIRIAKPFENLAGVAAERRAWPVIRLIVGNGERATYCYKFSDSATLVDFDKGIAVIQALVIHNFLRAKNRGTRHTERCKLGNNIKLRKFLRPVLDTGYDFVFMTVACIGGIEIGIGQPVLEPECLTSLFKMLRAALQDYIDVGIRIIFPAKALESPS